MSNMNEHAAALDGTCWIRSGFFTRRKRPGTTVLTKKGGGDCINFNLVALIYLIVFIFYFCAPGVSQRVLDSQMQSLATCTVSEMQARI
jgi:hypothetical protein